MKTTKDYTTFDMAKLFKIPRSNIQQYIDRGLLTPSVERTHGKGSKNRFSLDDLYRFCFFQKLYEVGLSQREASEKSQLIPFDGVGKRGKDWVKIIREDGKTKVVLTHRGSIQAEIRKKDVLIAINVLKVKEEVDALVA